MSAARAEAAPTTALTYATAMNDPADTVQAVLPEPIRPDRVAGDAIRGYLRQTIGIALEWIALPANAVLVCEGDEDFDCYLVDDQGAITDVTLGQTKDLTGSVSARNRGIVEVVGNFLVEFEQHSRAGRNARFVFTTTAARANQRLVSEGSIELGIDVLKTWSGLAAADDSARTAAVPALRLDVTRLLEAEIARLDKLEGAGPKHAATLRAALAFVEAEPERWATFTAAVCWEFGAPSLAQAITDLERLVAADPRTKHLPADLFAQRMTVSVLKASIPPDARERHLTRAMLDDLASTTRASLEEWSVKHHGARLTAWATRLDAIESDVRAIKSEIESARPLARVRRMSDRAHAELGKRAQLRIGGASAHLDREVIDRIATCARSGPLLVVGSPGVGKSAALHDVRSALVGAGVDTILLHADQLATDEALVRDALDEWTGTEPAVLLVDALDAVRDGTEADVLQRAVSGLVGKRGRWNVVASVRAYDLDHSRVFRAAFAASGTAPTSPRHPGVACIEVDELADADLEVLGTRLPALGVFLGAAPPDLVTLLRVPFHLELVCTLIDQGVQATELAHVTTRAQLLDEYWRRRIEHPTAQAAREALLHAVCDRMVTKRRMFASVRPALPQAQELGAVLSSGILIEPALDEGTRDDERVEFSHHVLFDYALARVWLPPEPDELTALLTAKPELVLFARPSLDLYFERLWHRDARRSRFWEAVLTTCANPQMPDVATIIGPGVCAHHAITLDDVGPLLAAVRAGTVGGLRALRHLELAMRGAPAHAPLRGAWDQVALQAARMASAQTRDVARLMVSTLIIRGRATDAAAGEAARLLFDAWPADPSARSLWLEAIPSVCATVSTDPAATSARIRTLITPAALSSDGHETLHRLAREIETLLVVPHLVRDVYVAAFAQASAYLHADEQVPFVPSSIVPMSTSRQSAYSNGLHVLAESYRAFLRASFADATAALFEIVDGEAATQAVPGNPAQGQLTTGGTPIVVTDDFGVSVPGPYSEVEQLVQAWLGEAQTPTIASSVASTITQVMVRRGPTSARVWRVLCELGRNAPQLMMPLTDLFESPDTYRLLGVRHAATAWLQTFFDQLPTDRREAIERAILLANGGPSSSEAVPGIDETLSSIADHLVTVEARALVDGLRAKGPLPENRPPVRFGRGRSQRLSPNDYLKELGVDPDATENQGLLVAARALPDTENVLEAARHLRTKIGESIGTADAFVQAQAWEAIVTAIATLAKANPSATDARAIFDLALECVAAPAMHVRADAVGVLGTLASREPVHADAVAHLVTLTRDEIPLLRQRALAGIGEAAQVSPQPLWDTIDARVPAEDDAQTQMVLLVELIQRAIALDPARALLHTLALLARTDGNADERDEVAENLHVVIAGRYIARGDAAYGTVAVAGLGTDLGLSRNRGLITARDWLQLPFQPDVALIACRARATELLLAAAASAGAVLATHATAPAEDLRRAAARMNLCAAELYFASGGPNDPPAAHGDLRAFLDLEEPLLRLLVSSGVPSVVHHAIQTLVRLLPADPARCYLLIAEGVAAGRQFGYEAESLAVDLVLPVTRHLLAEHRALVQTDAGLQAAIISVLGTFVRIGWVKAHALTFDLASVWR